MPTRPAPARTHSMAATSAYAPCTRHCTRRGLAMRLPCTHHTLIIQSPCSHHALTMHSYDARLQCAYCVLRARLLVLRRGVRCAHPPLLLLLARPLPTALVELRLVVVRIRGRARARGRARGRVWVWVWAWVWVGVRVGVRVLTTTLRRPGGGGWKISRCSTVGMRECNG